MWGVLEKVVEDSWSYKRSYLWCFGNPACVNSTGSKRTCFSINDLQFATLTYLNNEPVFKIYFCNEVRLLRFTNIPYICVFIIFCVFIFNLHLVFFISNYGQGSALKVANIFKVFVSQSCLIVSK